MDTSKLNPTGNRPDDKHQHRVGDKANELLKEGKKMAGDYYDDGLEKVHEAQESLKQYSDDILYKVRQKPLTAVLIAGGIGFLLSALLRK